MKIFRTPLAPGRSTHSITHQSALVTAGSCFADAIGSRLVDHKIPALVNPFGVLYNPVSLHQALSTAVLEGRAAVEGYGQHQGLWFHYDYHSAFSDPVKDRVDEKIRAANAEARKALETATTLILTYGTAWVYRRVDNGAITANCHKMPSALFSREMLGPEAIAQSFDALLEKLATVNPRLHFILTVSPVRHLKETLTGNALSKATLRLACEKIAQQYRDRVAYFPAFEIMIDDLRDYRFYQPDMIHPTAEAEDYIWDCFLQAFMPEATKALIQKWAGIRKALDHKPFHIASPQHQRFLHTLLRQLEDLSGELDLEAEMNAVKAQLSPLP